MSFVDVLTKRPDYAHNFLSPRGIFPYKNGICIGTIFRATEIRVLSLFLLPAKAAE
jgi:hypothetical protein